MKLINNRSKREMEVGDIVKTMQGVVAVLIGIEKPHKPASTGRVYLRSSEYDSRSYFPAVINCTWIDREDRP